MEEFNVFCLPECRARGHYLRLVHMMARQEYGVQMVRCFTMIIAPSLYLFFHYFVFFCVEIFNFVYWYCIGGSWCLQSNESFVAPTIPLHINNSDDLTIVRRKWLFREEMFGLMTPWLFNNFLRCIFYPHHYVLCPAAFDEKGIWIIPLQRSCFHPSISPLYLPNKWKQRCYFFISSIPPMH